MITIEDLYSYTTFIKGEYKLENMFTLINELDLNNLPYKIIHVAGTNGKGSVSLKIANTLTNSGYKTGLFSSPHLGTFRERIQIDKSLIKEEVAYTYIEEILDAYKRKNLKPTFFDIMTLLSFLYFKKEKVEFAVLETGLGGRLDSTNVVTPVLSVITSISLDHQAVLGNTLFEIAKEKAGIIKENIPVVIGPNANLKPIIEKASEKNAKVISIEESFSYYDDENQAIAKEALLYLQKAFSLTLNELQASLKIRPPCRFEIIENKVFDVAHNEEGMDRFSQSLLKAFPDKKFRFIVALSKDKNRVEILKKILNFLAPIHIVTSGERLASIHEIESDLKKLDYSNYFFEKSLEKTVQNALKLATANGEILVVTGSFFHMYDVKNALGITQDKDRLFLNEKMSV